MHPLSKWSSWHVFFCKRHLVDSHNKTKADNRTQRHQTPAFAQSKTPTLRWTQTLFQDWSQPKAWPQRETTGDKDSLMQWHKVSNWSGQGFVTRNRQWGEMLLPSTSHCEENMELWNQMQMFQFSKQTTAYSRYFRVNNSQTDRHKHQPLTIFLMNCGVVFFVSLIDSLTPAYIFLFVLVLVPVLRNVDVVKTC